MRGASLQGFATSPLPNPYGPHGIRNKLAVGLGKVHASVRIIEHNIQPAWRGAICGGSFGCGTTT